MRVVFVHGACVRDGAWWWGPTAAVLARAGVTSVAPVLPSCGETGVTAGSQGPGFAEDVAAVREVLTAGDEPTTVVAHSYGGIVTAQAAAGIGAVRRLVLVSSYLPEVGQGLSAFTGDEPAPFLDVDPVAGTLAVRPGAMAGTFMHDCPEHLDGALERLVHQSLPITAAVVDAAAWQQVPTTYLVCAEDRGTPPAAQRAFATRADRVVELAAGHHPFLSQPQAVADLVLDRG